MPLAPSQKTVSAGAWIVWSDCDTLAYAAKGNRTADFYSYDPLADSDGVWTPLAPIPPGEFGRLPKQGSCGASDNAGRVYAVTGNSTSSFWRYDVARAAWAALPPVPLMASGRRVSGGSAMVYVVERETGYVYLLKGRTREFLRFNTVAGAWDTALQQCPCAGAPWGEGSWLVAVGDSIIYAHRAARHELREFNVRTHAWALQPQPGMPYAGMTGKYRKSRAGGCAAFINGRILALKGGNTQEFWCFNPETDSWHERDTIPAFGSTGRKKRIGPGGAIAGYGSMVLFALKGNKTCEAWSYIESAEPSDQEAGLFLPRARAAGQQSGKPAPPDSEWHGMTVVRDVSGRLTWRGRGQPAELRPGIYFVRRESGGPARKLVVTR